MPECGKFLAVRVCIAFAMAGFVVFSTCIASGARGSDTVRLFMKKERRRGISYEKYLHRIVYLYPVSETIRS